MSLQNQDIWTSWNTSFVAKHGDDHEDDWTDEDDEDLDEMPEVGTLTLERSGRFTLGVKGPAHCGVREPDVECSYDVRIVCEPYGLDPKGFLVEQLGIHEFFQNLPETKLSCERLVVWCAKKLREKILDENPSCVIRKMSVKISPVSAEGSASMTYDWEPDADGDDL